MEVAFKYGLGTIKIKLPQQFRVQQVSPSLLPPAAAVEPSKIIKEALRNPIASAPFHELFNKGDKVAIVVSDITRKTKADLFLPIILDELNLSGVCDNDIFIVFATGSHRPHTIEEQRKIIGEEASQRVRFYDHDPTDKSNLVYLCKTSRQTPLWINKEVKAADKVILTGAITYHYYAGFGGGRKSVVPGIAGYETIQANHKLLFNLELQHGRNPRCASGILDGNPVNMDMEEAADKFAPTFIINTVLNNSGELCQVFAGNYKIAHRVGCKYVEKTYSVAVEEPADLVIVSCGGFPQDINYYQAHKALDNAFKVVKRGRGGVIILLAECKEGLGYGEAWFKYPSLEILEKELRKEYSVEGYNAYTTLEKTKQATVFLVSSLSDEQAQLMNCKNTKSAQEAIELSIKYLPQQPKVYVLPEGFTTLPYIKT